MSPGDFGSFAQIQSRIEHLDSVLIFIQDGESIGDMGTKFGVGLFDEEVIGLCVPLGPTADIAHQTVRVLRIIMTILGNAILNITLHLLLC